VVSDFRDSMELCPHSPDMYLVLGHYGILADCMEYVGVFFFHLHCESRKVDIRIFDLVRRPWQSYGDGDGDGIPSESCLCRARYIIILCSHDFILRCSSSDCSTQYARMSSSKESANEAFPNNVAVTISEFERHLELMHLSQV